MVAVAEAVQAADPAKAALAVGRQGREPAPETYARRARRFRASAAWHRTRVNALADNRRVHGGRNRCELCGSHDGPWHADHIVPVSKDWSKRLDPNNIQILCRDCNYGKSNLHNTDWRKDSEDHAERG